MWLKLYCLFMAILSISSFVSTGLSTVMDYVILAETTLEMIGLFGYAFSRPSFNERFWKVLFPMFVVFDVFTAFYQSQSLKVTLLSLLFEVVLGWPMYVSLFRYGYRSIGLWQVGK